MSASASRTRERLALGVEHFGVAGVDRHARADGRLRQVHRCDVAVLEVGERVGQLGLERGDELAARGGGRIRGARAADEDDAGGEGVGADAIDCELLSSVRIGQVPLMAKPARITASRKVSQPVLAVPSSLVALRLLEGVVDGDRKGRVRLLGEAVHRLRHAVEEECFRLLLAAMAVRRGDQLLGLGHGERGEEIGEDRLQRAAQPDVEEVREVSVTDVVVVGRIGRDDSCPR